MNSLGNLPILRVVNFSDNFRISIRTLPSSRHRGENIRPSTANKEGSGLKGIFDKAIRDGQPKYSPIDKVKKLSENNVRERVLTLQEFKVLIDACDIHIRPVITMAYYMGMRKSEIIRLIWPKVDLKKGSIGLSAKRT